MGVLLAGTISFTSTRASPARPRSVRAPQRTMASAAPAMAARRDGKFPWERRLQCRSPPAATRIVVPFSTADDFLGRLYGRRPLRDLLGSERAAGHQSPVGVPPTGHVGQVLLAGEQRALAYALIGSGAAGLALEKPAAA